MARKEKNIHYIYKTTCNLTGRWYVGMHSTCNLEDGYMGSGKRLRYSIRKYGLENHTKEILEFCESRELLIDAEKKVITTEMISDKNCMNLCFGGQGGPIRLGLRHSEESKLKISKSLTGKIFSDERKERISKSGQGKHSGPLSFEHKLNISKSKKGQPSKLKDVPRSEITKEKISKKNKNNPVFKLKRKPLSKETREKIGCANKLKLSKKVIQLNKYGNVLKIWDSIILAEKTLKISHISSVCNGKRKTSGGYIWQYY